MFNVINRFNLYIYVIEDNTIVFSTKCWLKKYKIKIIDQEEKNGDFGIWDIILHVSYKNKLELKRHKDNACVVIYNLSNEESNNYFSNTIQEIKERKLSFETDYFWFFKSENTNTDIPWIIPLN